MIFFIFNSQAPVDFPLNIVYTIEKGAGLNSTASDLVNKKIIKSAFYFKVFSVLSAGPKGIIAGDYSLNSKENVFTLAKRMTSGDYEIQKVKITFPEGLNVFEIAKLISAKFVEISEKDFLEKARALEGYLFPDTYIFEANTDSETIIKSMRENFKQKIIVVKDLINKSGHSESDIIKMASIVEEEGRTTETRQIIAGILWKRLSLNMPLQVDSSFKYINGKTTKDLILADLKIDSPYNSYLYKGLPPTPISNPGLDSIKATLLPIKTSYLYFLNDTEGKMHYAKTYAEHLQNKELYLK